MGHEVASEAFWIFLASRVISDLVDRLDVGERDALQVVQCRHHGTRHTAPVVEANQLRDLLSARDAPTAGIGRGLDRGLEHALDPFDVLH
jgi:hypothetical protein